MANIWGDEPVEEAPTGLMDIPSDGGVFGGTEDDYGWGIKNAFMRGVTRVGQLTDLAQEDWEEYAEGEKELEKYPVSDYDQKRMEKLQETDGFWSAVGEYVKNPALAMQVVAESLPISAPVLAGGAVGAGVGSQVPVIGTTVGAIAGVGAMSFTVDYLATISGKMAEEAKDPSDPKALKAAYADPEFMARARESGVKHGIPVAAFDAISMGLAGKIYKPVKVLAGAATKTGAVAGATSEIAAQGFAGAAGEAGGQIFDEGEISSMPEVAAEFIGELVPGVGEIAISKTIGRKKAQPQPTDEIIEDDGGVLASTAPSTEPFYSALTRTVEQAEGMPKKGSAAMFKTWLNGRQGLKRSKKTGEMIQTGGDFKAEERDWIGLDDWLDSQEGVITRADVQGFVRDNHVRVEEVTRGGPGPNPDELGRDPFGPQPGVEEETGGWLGPKFEKYQLPGGKNYRELLLTLPLNKEVGYNVIGKNGELLLGEIYDKATAEKMAVQQGGTVQETEISRPGVGDENYTDGHYAEPNILAHVRFNERTDETGGRMLFIEETQSDWAQEGREKGFYNPKRAQLSSEMDILREKASKRPRLTNGAYDYAEDLDRADSIEKQLRDLKTLPPKSLGAVIDMPFKNTKSWSMLAMKRMIKYAADNNFDSIGWTTGEQQVERYQESLRSQVDRIEWTKEEGGIRLVGTKEGRDVVDTKEKESDLSKAIGKSMGKQIIEDENQTGVLEGDDITIDSVGMKKFYDDMLVNNTNRFVKKWSGRVSSTDIGDSRKPYPVTDGRGQWRIYNPATEDYVLNDFTNAVEDYTSREKANAAIPANVNSVPVHYLKLTPQMKAAGSMPLFSKAKTSGKLTTTSVQKAVNQALAPRHAKKINVVQNADQIPNVENMLQVGNNEGFYDPKTKNIYLIADNISSEARAAWVAWHELFHKGVRVKYGKLLANALSTADKNGTVQKLANAIIKDRNLNPDNRQLAVEEALAELNAAQRTGDYAGINERYGVKIPESLQAGWRNALKRFMERLKTLMSKVTGEEVSDAEVWSLFRGADMATGVVVDTIPAEITEPLASVTPKYKDPHLNSAAKKIGRGPLWKKNLKDIAAQPKVWLKNLKDSMNQGIFDKYYGILKAIESTGQKIDAATNGYISARLSTSVQDRVAVLLKHAQMKWVNGVLTPIDGTKGFLKVLDPISDKLDEFGMYLMGLRAKEIAADDKKTPWSADEIEAMIRQGDTNPLFEPIRLEYMEINKSVLDIAMEAGLINKKTRALWENDNYVPFYRIMEEGSVGPRSKRALEGQKSGIMRMSKKGSERQMGDPLENIMANWAHLIDASVKNKATIDTINNLKGSGLIEKAPRVSRPKFASAEALKKEVAKTLDGKGVSEEIADMLTSEKTLKGLRQIWSIEPPSGPDIIRVMRKGKPEYYRVNDTLLLRSLSAVNEQQWGKHMNVFRIPKRILTSMVTADPAFMLRNFVRDTLSTFVLGRDRVTPGVAAVKGFAKAYRETPEMVAAMAAGGSFSTGGYLNASDPTSMSRFIKAEVKHAAFEKTLLNSPKRLWDFWQHLGSSIENSNRVSLFLAARDSGKGAAQAAYEMKDIMDFSMRGDYAVIQFLSESVPFFSARLQGLQRLYRGAKEHPGAFAAKGSLIMFSSIALYMSNRDDDRYKKLEEWDKDTYFHFFIGDEHYRMPKPFEVGVLFGTFPERLAEALIEEDSGFEELIKRASWNFAQTLSLNPSPQVVKPIFEDWANRSFFTKRPIVGMRLKKMTAEAQYQPWTSETMRALGQAFGVSPKRAEALVRGYFGTLGSYALAISDVATRQLMDYPNPPSMKLEDMAVISAFYRGDKNSVPRNTKYTTEFYEMVNEVSELYNAINDYREQGEGDLANEMLVENRDKLKYYRGLMSRQKSLSGINKQIRRLHYNKNISGENKRRRIDSLLEKKNRITQATVEKLKDF